MIEKDYILARMRNGESIETIGQDIADMMNQAQAQWAKEEAEKVALAAKQVQETRKRELLNEFISLIQEWGRMEGIDEEFLTVSEEESEQLLEALNATFSLMKDLRNLVSATEKPVVKIRPRNASFEGKLNMDDDTILAEFAKMFK